MNSLLTRVEPTDSELVESKDSGLWSFMKEHRNFWLMQLAFIVLLLAILMVWMWGDESVAPARALDEVGNRLF